MTKAQEGLRCKLLNRRLGSPPNASIFLLPYEETTRCVRGWRGELEYHDKGIGMEDTHTMTGRIKIGLQLHPQHTTYEAFADAVKRAEDLGADTIWNWDHFFPLSG